MLARPRCYMNETGGPVSALAKFYKVPVDQVVAVHDELDLAFDTLRVKLGGGDNGHNGLRSIRRSWGRATSTGCASASAARPGGRSPADFVLSDYSATERKVLPLQVDRAADAVESLLSKGWSGPRAVQRLTGRRR